MSLEAAASALSQARLQTDVSFAVARKQLNAQRQQGDAVVALIQAAANVGKSNGSDALAVAATGKGGNLDVYG